MLLEAGNAERTHKNLRKLQQEVSLKNGSCQRIGSKNLFSMSFFQKCLAHYLCSTSFKSFESDGLQPISDDLQPTRDGLAVKRIKKNLSSMFSKMMSANSILVGFAAVKYTSPLRKNTLSTGVTILTTHSSLVQVRRQGENINAQGLTAESFSSTRASSLLVFNAASTNRTTSAAHFVHFLKS